jgi:hypothetical protein
MTTLYPPLTVILIDVKLFQSAFTLNIIYLATARKKSFINPVVPCKNPSASRSLLEKKSGRSMVGQYLQDETYNPHEIK